MIVCSVKFLLRAKHTECESRLHMLSFLLPRRQNRENHRWLISGFNLKRTIIRSFMLYWIAIMEIALTANGKIRDSLGFTHVNGRRASLKMAMSELPTIWSRNLSISAEADSIEWRVWKVVIKSAYNYILIFTAKYWYKKWPEFTYTVIMVLLLKYEPSIIGLQSFYEKFKVQVTIRDSFPVSRLRSVGLKKCQGTSRV